MKPPGTIYEINNNTSIGIQLIQPRITQMTLIKKIQI